MIRAVLDTNIIISSVFWKGAPYEIVRKGMSENYKMVTSIEILEEVMERLVNKFKFPEEKTRDFIDMLLVHSEIIAGGSKFDISRDNKDNKIIECAFDGKANYVVSGDSDLLELKEFRGIKIVKARNFLEVL